MDQTTNMENEVTLESASRVNMDLANMISEAKAAEEEKSKDVEVAVPEASALQKAIAAKEKQQQGLVMTTQEYEEGLHNKPLRASTDTLEREEDVKKSLSEVDELMEKRKDIVLLKSPTTDVEYVELMDEINSLTTRPDGTKAFIRKDEERLDEENWETKEEEYVPKWIRLRTEEDGEYSKENDKKIFDKEATENAENVEDTTEEASPEDEERRKVVEVLIDKTGMGASFNFSDEEKAKIIESDVIRLKQVKTMELKSLKIIKKQSSFQEKVNEHRLTGGGVRMYFPASGFSADMTGLTYAELSDLAVDVDDDEYVPSVEEYYKRYTVIFNHMKNISRGEFDNFEDFLRHFAFVDTPLAVYGLVIATFPEINTIGLKCGDKKCDKDFNWNYYTRALIDYNECSDDVVNGINRLMKAKAGEYDTFAAEADVNNVTLIELPYSKKVICVTTVSAYEYIYNIIPILDPDTFKAAFGDSIAHLTMSKALFAVNKVLTPAVDKETGESGYEEHEGYKEILDELCDTHPLENQIINGYVSNAMQKYQVFFALKDVECPHCHRKTKVIPINIDSLVFRIYQTVATTEIEV